MEMDPMLMHPVKTTMHEQTRRMKRVPLEREIQEYL